jgi:predicted enzyme related to lactoylglutathione lyase
MLALNNANGMEHNDDDSIINQREKQTKSYISIFEIPATDIKRAIKFYKAILDIDIEHMEMPGMEMGILPFENQQFIGVIMKGEGYEPSTKGVTIYLNGGDDLQVILEKVEQNGGSILVPKTAHADESGFFALFIDTEGNKMGVHSPN